MFLISTVEYAIHPTYCALLAFIVIPLKLTLVIPAVELAIIPIYDVAVEFIVIFSKLTPSITDVISFIKLP